MSRHIPWASALALVLVLSVGCVTDLADGFRTTATVTKIDGTTPLAEFQATSYEAIFHLYDGMNVARTFTPTAEQPLKTDANGKFSLHKFDVDLYTTGTRVDCYDTCVAWDTDCYVDSWGDYVCHDYCSWYVTDCYDREYTVGVDINSVESVTTFLNFPLGIATVRTPGLSTINSRDIESNTWVREERFITPFFNGSQPPDGSAPAVHSLPAPKRTACADQAELSEEQMAQLRRLRAHLGVEDAEVACRR